MQKSLKKRREIIEQAKKEEREAIELQRQAQEEERCRRQASASGDFGGPTGSGAMAAAAAPTGAANGGYPRKVHGMNRRTQSSTGDPFLSGRVSTEAGHAGRRVGGAAAESGSNGSGRQPNTFEQLRQACMEDTLTDFFGL